MRAAAFDFENPAAARAPDRRYGKRARGTEARAGAVGSRRAAAQRLAARAASSDNHARASGCASGIRSGTPGREGSYPRYFNTRSRPDVPCRAPGRAGPTGRPLASPGTFRRGREPAHPDGCDFGLGELSATGNRDSALLALWQGIAALEGTDTRPSLRPRLLGHTSRWSHRQRRASCKGPDPYTRSAGGPPWRSCSHREAAGTLGQDPGERHAPEAPADRRGPGALARRGQG